MLKLSKNLARSLSKKICITILHEHCLAQQGHMTTPIILSTQALDDYAEQSLSRYGRFVVAKAPTTDGLQSEINNAIALVVRGQVPITASLMDAAPHLKVIGRTGVGYETVDIAAASARGIPVVHTPGVGARAVAEAAIAFMLALCKMIAYWDEQTKAGNWNSRITAQGFDLDGKTLGIVGLGRIGQILAQMAAPFEMKVIAYDPYIAPSIAHGLNVELVGLDELLNASDFVSLHCPQNNETMGLISRTRLAMMKQGAYLINLARGGIIESLDPIHEMLVSGHLRGAALDVFLVEPPDHSHPIFRLNNCLVSPHAMATTAGAMRRIFKCMADDMAAILSGQMPQFVVNPETLKNYDT